MAIQAPATLGERIRALRAAAQISARDLSRACGLSVAHVSHLETGRIARPSARTVQLIAAALGATSSWLLDGRGRPPSAASLRARFQPASAA